MKQRKESNTQVKGMGVPGIDKSGAGRSKVQIWSGLWRSEKIYALRTCSPGRLPPHGLFTGSGGRVAAPCMLMVWLCVPVSSC